MTARTKILQPGHRVSVRNGTFKTQDTTIVLAPGDTLTVTTVAAPPVPPPSTGIPPIPAGGALFRHNFATDGMGPFSFQAWINDRDFGTNNWMRQYCRYGDTATVHDGYLDLPCLRNPAVASPTAADAWYASFVGTFSPTGGYHLTKSFTPPFRVRWCLAFDTAGNKAAWLGAWEYGTWLHGNNEVDWPETIAGKATANLHNPDAGQLASVPIPTGWHVWETTVTTAAVTVRLDDVLARQRAWSAPGPFGLFLDAKVGLAAPDETGPVRLKAAWVLVDVA